MAGSDIKDAIRSLPAPARSVARLRKEVEIVVELAPDLLPEDGACPEDVAGFLASHGLRPYRIQSDYSPAAYVHRAAVARPVPIDSFPSNTEQFDVTTRAETLMCSRLRW
jgi:hypothetical protein